MSGPTGHADYGCATASGARGTKEKLAARDTGGPAITYCRQRCAGSDTEGKNPIFADYAGKIGTVRVNAYGLATAGSATVSLGNIGPGSIHRPRSSNCMVPKSKSRLSRCDS